MALISTKRTRRVTGKNYPIRGYGVTPFAGAARTAATGDSDSFDTSEINTLVLTLTQTAHTGTNPTLDVKLQTSHDAGSTWVDVVNGAFTQRTTTDAAETLAFTRLGALCRVHFAIGGTGSPGFTFSVAGYGK